MPVTSTRPLFEPLQWLLLALCWLFAGHAAAAGVGTLVYVSGDARIVAIDGKTRVLRKGAALDQGETVVTGKEGQAEIRFSDESLVQLQPRSEFRVDEYVYHGKADGKEKGFFSLLKGGFRTLTGMIGKINRPAYAVYTATATIGIRGTDYSANLKDGLHVSVDKGEISVTNRAGSFAVAEGQSAYVSSPDTPPSYLQSGGAQSGDGKSGAAGRTRIRGNTRIDASTSNTSASAVGRGNAAKNQAGVIGGE
ncbi:MAG: FecR family protein [Sterolibacterium sp.]|nr:FecR family protein [Sterolibacterium sp.]